MKVKDLIIPISTDITKMVKGYNKAMLKTKQFQDGVNKVGKSFVRFGVIMTGLGAISVKLFGSFEAGINEINSLLDDSNKHFIEPYKKAILDMSAEFGEGTATMTKGLYDIVSAGIDADKSISVLEASVITAKAGLTTTGIAADAITTILNSYGLEAERAAEVSDWLFTVVKKGKTTMSQLAPSVGKVASLAAIAGISLDDFGAALATMTAGGIKTDIAMTNLKGIITAFISGSDDAKAAAAKFGLELSSNSLKTLGLVGILKKLEGATAEQLRGIFANLRGLSGMATMLKNTAKLTENYSAMIHKNGAAQKAFETVAKGVNWQIGLLWAKFKVLVITMGEKLAPTFNKLSEAMSKIIDRISKLSSKQIGSIVNFAKWTTIIVTSIGLLLQLGVGLAKAVTFWKIFQAATLASSAATALPTAIFGASATAQAASTVATTASTTALALNTKALSIQATVIKTAALTATASYGIALSLLAVVVAGITVAYYKWNKAINENTEAQDSNLKGLETVHQKQKKGFAVLKEFRDAEVKDIEDLEGAYKKVTEGIKGLYTTASLLEGEGKKRILDSIVLLEAKRDIIKNAIDAEIELAQAQKLAEYNEKEKLDKSKTLWDELIKKVKDYKKEILTPIAETITQQATETFTPFLASGRLPDFSLPDLLPPREQPNYGGITVDGRNPEQKLIKIEAEFKALDPESIHQSQMENFVDRVIDIMKQKEGR